MAYEVMISRRALKNLRRLPDRVKDLFDLLVADLETKGPLQPGWRNYSKLGPDMYHCHLTYAYVACWRHEKGTITIEVYYVGSREKAPY